MKISILSDLHREFWQVDIPYYTDSDVVIFAGDIACPIEKSMDFLIEYSNKRKLLVIAVLGNHDFYRSNYEEALNYAAKRTKESKYLYLLENSSCIIDNVKFIGCTLWSDFSYETGGNISLQEDNAYIAQANVADFYEIRFGKNNKRFSAMKCMSLYNESINFLKEELSKDFSGKTIVVTHFGIDKKCSNSKHFDSRLQPYFISNVSEILNNFKLDFCIHGHTHFSNSFSIGNTKVISNQVGYPRENEKDVRTNMNLSLRL